MIVLVNKTQHWYSGVAIRRAGAAALIACMVALTGCATEPYARVDTNDFNTTSPERAPVRIVAIDDQWFLSGLQVENVAPGLRNITFVSTFRPIGQRPPIATGPTSSSGGAPMLEFSKTIAFDFKPCVHYFFYARHPVETDEREWQVVLDRARPIAECSVAQSGDTAQIS